MPKLHELTEHKGRMRPVGIEHWMKWSKQGVLKYIINTDGDLSGATDITYAMLTCDWETEDVGVTITTKEFWDLADEIASDDRDTDMCSVLAKSLGLGPKPD